MTKREFFENVLKMKPSDIGTAIPFNLNGETEVTEAWLVSFIKNLLTERSIWHTGIPIDEGWYLLRWHNRVERWFSLEYLTIEGISKLHRQGKFVDCHWWQIEEPNEEGEGQMTLDESIELWQKEHEHEIVYACNMDSEVHEIVDRINPWHSGTPTEEGWYLCQTKGRKGSYLPSVLRWNGEIWTSKSKRPLVLMDVVAWQKITPYEGEVTNG